jgi:hypothetical protein
VTGEEVGQLGIPQVLEDFPKTLHQKREIAIDFLEALPQDLVPNTGVLRHKEERR